MSETGFAWSLSGDGRWEHFVRRLLLLSSLSLSVARNADTEKEDRVSERPFPEDCAKTDSEWSSATSRCVTRKNLFFFS